MHNPLHIGLYNYAIRLTSVRLVHGCTTGQWCSYTRAYPGLCPHKIRWCTRVKIMWKAKVDQVLACAIASLMWTEASTQERLVFVAENGSRSDFRVYNSSWRERAPNFLADVCYARTGWAHAVPMELAHPG